MDALRLNRAFVVNVKDTGSFQVLLATSAFAYLRVQHWLQNFKYLIYYKKAYMLSIFIKILPVLACTVLKSV